MFVRCKALLLLSAVGAVLGTSNRCHPENGAAACFDPSNPCPWSVANESHRLTLQICADKRPVQGIKRCAAAQQHKCIDPAEGICTPVEAQLSQGQIDDLKLCTDKEHLYKRCHPLATTRCFHPLQQCVGAERDGITNDADGNGSVCPDLQVLSAERCAASQPFRCIDPTNTVFGRENANCPNSVIAANNLKFCDEINHVTKKRCHPWSRDPCIDSGEECPYDVRPAETRSSLGICPEKVPIADKLRCHADQVRIIQTPTGAVNTVACLDPRLSNTEQNQSTCSAASAPAFAELKICEDLAHFGNRCDKRYISNDSRCLHPLQQCLGHDRTADGEGNGSLPRCNDLQTFVAGGADRCDANQPYRCINPDGTTFGQENGRCSNSVIAANNLKFCDDVDHATKKRCHPWSRNSCFDPAEECQYSFQPVETRSFLSVCPDKTFVATKLRCHTDQTQRCLDPRLTDVQQSQTTCGAAIGQLKICEDLAHFGNRCDKRYIRNDSRCLHPLQQCLGHDRTADGDGNGGTLPRCNDLQTFVAGGADRCDANQPYRCINPAGTTFGRENARCPNSVIAANNLKFCDDVDDASRKRCHPWSRNSCFDPLDDCPWTVRPRADRLTLPICSDLAPRTDRLRCHKDQTIDKACRDPDQEFQESMENCGWTAGGPDTNNYDGLKVCEDKSHQIKRCAQLQKADTRCFYPTEQCVGFGANEERTDVTDVCPDVIIDTTKLRCDPSQQVPCIKPGEALCANMTGLVICNDLDPRTFNPAVKRCDRRQAEPCIADGQSCTLAENPSQGPLKICEDQKALFARCDPRQRVPCLTYKPEDGKGCTLQLLGNQTLSVCADSVANAALNAELLTALDASTPTEDQQAALCGSGANCKHPGATHNDCDDKTMCEHFFFRQDPNSAASVFCKDIDTNSRCLSPGETAGANGCPAANDIQHCSGYEDTPCAPRRNNRCFEIASAKACFENVAGLSRCSSETSKINFSLKRCHAGQSATVTVNGVTINPPTNGVSCWDPSESDCTPSENTNVAGTIAREGNFVYACGDKAHLAPRSHKRQHSPCLERTRENLPNYSSTENANSFTVAEIKDATTVTALCPEIARAVNDAYPTCDPIQGNQACIDPSPNAVQCTPVDSSLKYCADKIVPLLGTANEVNRCHPLNRNPCIDPRTPCPFEYIAQQPGISVCSDFALPAKRCAANNNPWGACYFVGADGTPETCTPAENASFATLQVCPDAATRLNRCHSRQRNPCRDPTNPCTTALNPNMVTLGICTDLVSMAPSTLPSQIPSNVPSNVPSMVPSSTPSLSMAPSEKPSLSAAPSSKPSEKPSASPSALPSASPSDSPSDQPSASPSAAPSAKPSTSASPSAKPSPAPSQSPSGLPSSSPSASPTLSSVPSATPSFRPTVSMKPTFKGQTFEPSDTPSASPSASPSEAPSSSPSASPSSSPSASPLSSPSSSPSASPSSSPSSSPSASPTLLGGPSATPSVNCVDDPDFRLDAIERRNCEWARENPDRVDIRCGKVDSVTNVAVADACPLSCNPECEEFVPTATPETPEPTVSPETQCGEDDPTPFFVTSNPQKVRNCEWVGFNNRKRETRCRKEATDGELVSTKCTFTCQLRCVCKNSKKRFGLNGERVRCADVRRNQCDQGVVKERCPKKCNFCFDLL